MERDDILNNFLKRIYNKFFHMYLPKTTYSWVHKGAPCIDKPFGELLTLKERVLPPLTLGSALIEIDGAPVNPSDIMFIRGQYGVKPQAGDVPGFEGCGTVLDANAGPYGWWLKGQRVSFGAQDGNGSWTRYAVVSIFSCIPVSRSLPVETAATLIVNPMTAIGLIARARKHGTKAIVVNAAGSALGRYLFAIARWSGLEFIGLVRRAESANALHEIGAKHILVTSESDFIERFRDLSQQLDARVLLDAVAGDETALLMNAMPDRTLAIVYGQLSQAGGDGARSVCRVSLDSTGLVFRKQRTEGYWLTHELHGFNGMFVPLLRAKQISKLYQKGIFTTSPITATSLEDLIPTIDQGVRDSKIVFLSRGLSHR